MPELIFTIFMGPLPDCLLYTSDAADERSSVDLGGRRIIKNKNNKYIDSLNNIQIHTLTPMTDKTSA